MVNITSFIKYTNLVNNIFKNIYNSEDKFQNVWYCREGKFFMYHENQFPSYIEISLDYNKIKKTSKGKLTKQAIALKEYIEFFKENKINFRLNSIELYECLKNKKLITDIKYENNNIIIEKSDGNNLISNFDAFPKEYDFNPKNKLAEFDIEDNLVEKILDKGNNPFFFIWNFNDIIEDTVNIDDNINYQLGFLRVKLNKKFIPYLCRKKINDEEYKYSELSLELYATDLDGIYDLVFISSFDELTVTSVIRVLDLV